MNGEAFRIELQACDPEQNRRRFYIIDAGRDLFGDMIVEFNYGRIGTRGQRKIHLVENEHAAKRLVLANLRRRQSAPRRIGVAYVERVKYDPYQWTNCAESSRM